MRRVILSVTAIVLVLTMMFAMTGCGAKSEIKDVIKKYEKACNEVDFDGILSCMHPSQADAIKLAAGIVGFFGNVDSDKMLEKLSSFLSDKVSFSKEFFESLEITVDEIDVDDDKADVDVFVTYKLNGQETTVEADMEFTKYEDVWYIAKFNLDK
ncbi:MAG: hypothetical protein IKU45_04380 [Clostridia bacterium]|nr:hypothetical protein [Clostridia bacterium]